MVGVDFRARVRELARCLESTRRRENKSIWYCSHEGAVSPGTQLPQTLGWVGARSTDGVCGNRESWAPCCRFEPTGGLNTVYTYDLCILLICRPPARPVEDLFRRTFQLLQNQQGVLVISIEGTKGAPYG